MGKLYEGLMGLVVGDALGVPYEFMERDSFNCTDMVGYGTHNQPPGTWSDDTSLTLATLDSIGQCKGINPDDMMSKFSRWLHDCEYTPYGRVFDVGITTRFSIDRYRNGVPLALCGGRGVNENGNGALMRILPLAFVEHTGKDIEKVAGLTHAHEISQTACRLYVHLVRLILDGTPLKNAICSLAYLPPVTQKKEFKGIAYIGELTRDEIKSGGYVVDTLEAALWCLYHTDNYRDCVLTAVNLGSDTDTTAAVAGGLAGIVYGIGGEKGIPQEWIEQTPRLDYIKKLCEKVEEVKRV